MNGNRLDALSRRDSGMLRRIGIDGEPMDAGKEPAVGVFTRQNLGINRPTCRGRLHIIVDRPFNFTENGAAACTGCLFHGGLAKMTNIAGILANGETIVLLEKVPSRRRIRGLLRQIGKQPDDAFLPAAAKWRPPVFLLSPSVGRLRSSQQLRHSEDEPVAPGRTRAAPMACESSTPARAAASNRGLAGLSVS
jgi:hypothetical protein